MYDRVSSEQQRKEKQDAMAPARDSLPVSDELIRTGQRIQDTRGGDGLTMSPRAEWFWPNSSAMDIDSTTEEGVLEVTRRRQRSRQQRY